MSTQDHVLTLTMFYSTRTNRNLEEWEAIFPTKCLLIIVQRTNHVISLPHFYGEQPPSCYPPKAVAGLWSESESNEYIHVVLVEDLRLDPLQECAMATQI